HGGHDHGPSHGRSGFLRELLPFGHGHSHGEPNVDTALETSERGIWALKVSLVGLGASAIFQLIIVLISGSVGLLADPIVGLLITIAIVFIVKDTAVVMWQRMMDAVDPEVTESIERTAAAAPGVRGVHSVRVRWLGHKLQTELHITVDEDLNTTASHRIAEEVRHALYHAQPRLAEITVHVDPCGHSGEDAHELTAHHYRPQPIPTGNKGNGGPSVRSHA
ncbi:MAG: hypothetical protein M3281_05190, partial [Chloroflexota bacterium]|nr:hypothetical protein [Chloroflexota bacterium]